MSEFSGRASIRRARRKDARWRKVLVRTTLVLAVVAAAGGVTAFVAIQRFDHNITSDDISAKLGTDRPQAQTNAAGQKPLNILLIGSDSRAGDNKHLGGGTESGQRSDTTILLHVSGDRKHAVGVSFPRDTLVDVPSCVMNNGRRSLYQHLAMFNSAFSLGGPACTIKTVEKLTDIRVDHFVVIDFKGFAKMVDAVGGVPICLPSAVNDTTGHIKLKAGKRTVHGEEALDYVRLRHDASIGGNGSDLGRIDRQQTFLSALASKVKSNGVLLNPVKLVRVLNAATKAITTDTGLDSVRKLASLAQSVRGLNTKDITFVTLPVHAYAPNPNRVVVTEDTAEPLFSSIKADQATFGKAPVKAAATTTPAKPTVRPSQIAVRVLNGSGTPGRARLVASALRRQGFRVVALATAPQTTRRSAITYPAGRSQSVKTLEAAVPVASARVSRNVQVITLVVGRDLTASGVQEVEVAQPKEQTKSTSTELQTKTADTDICAT